MTTAVKSPRQFDEDQLALDMIAGIAGTTGLTQRQKQTVAQHAQALLQHMLDSPARLWRMWTELCDLAIATGLEGLHRCREKIAAGHALKEELVQHGSDLARRIEKLLGGPLEGVDRLPAASEELRRFKTTVLDRWQSLDDLAEMLIEKIHLPAEHLKLLAKHYPPPPSWYEEDFDPFTPDTPK
jgi:hypothetical protein